MSKIVETHRCVGDPDECETPAVCEECGHSATPDKPVLALKDEDGDAFFCVDHLTPVTILGYNDDEAKPEVDTRWCTVCLADRTVKREYPTNVLADPTTAYELTCGHHTIDL